MHLLTYIRERREKYHDLAVTDNSGAVADDWATFGDTARGWGFWTFAFKF